MQVNEVMMTHDARVIDPEQNIQEAGKMMRDFDIGVLPVSEDDRLMGMISDRGVAVRAIAAGMRPSTRVRDVMSAEVKYCYEAEDIEHVAQNMGHLQVRCLPVLNRDSRLVGLLSLADVAVKQGAQPAGTALAGVSPPGGPHAQSSWASQRKLLADATAVELG